MATLDVDQDKGFRRIGSTPLSDDGRRPALGSGALRTKRLQGHSVLAGAGAVLVGYLILSGLLVAAGLVITNLLPHSVGSWDEHVNSWFAQRRSPGVNRLSGDFTFLADTLGIGVVAAVAVGVTLLVRRARLAAMLLIALATELTVFFTVNYAVGRPRPHVSHVGSTPSTYSWPSGHVAATLVLYGGIALIVTTVTRRPVPRAAAWLVAASLVVCVAGARVYEGEHHPTDALAGLLLGIGALWVANRAMRACQSGARTAGRSR